jgi:cobalt/nickel transport system permease protein
MMNESRNTVVDPMHIPDGFLSLPMVIITFGLAAAFWVIASLKSKTRITERQIPLLAMITAFIFVAQMINFPIFGGTSGHLLGAALVAILLGPYASLMSITVVLFIQAFMFGDGGVSALGANILNMGIIGAYSAYLIYRLIAGSSNTGKRVAVGIFAAAYTSLVLGAVACGFEIGFSSVLPFAWELTVPAMLFWHAIIGLIEGSATLFVLSVLLKYKVQLLGPLMISGGEKGLERKAKSSRR